MPISILRNSDTLDTTQPGSCSIGLQYHIHPSKAPTALNNSPLDNFSASDILVLGAQDRGGRGVGHHVGVVLPDFPGSLVDFPWHDLRPELPSDGPVGEED